MKKIYPVIALFLIFMNPSAAQSDSLASDSLKSATLDLRAYPTGDSALWNWNKGGYIGCIIPLPEEPETGILSTSVYIYESPFTAKGAREHLKEGKPLILFPGGIFGPDFSSKADEEFQAKYRVNFYAQGCLRNAGDEEEAYNRIIFAYLDQKFGKGWRDELRPDAIGFEAPLTSNTKTIINLNSPLAMQIANPTNSARTDSVNLDPETSIWWYVLPTSGFALLLALYFIKRKKD